MTAGGDVQGTIFVDSTEAQIAALIISRDASIALYGTEKEEAPALKARIL